MGGNALKNCETHRLDAEDYIELCMRVCYLLHETFPGRELAEIPAYDNKVDFGDLDIIITSEVVNGIEVTAELITKVFQSKEVVRNGDVFSFEFEGFQVDLILMPSWLFNVSYNYYSFNDLGNLMGRIAHKMGFRYGHAGLTYQLRTSDDHVSADITLSVNSADIFKFLGYSWERFMEGFNELDEVFEFAASTPFFNKQIYLLENRNAVSRVRDKKRKTYSTFLLWLQEQKGLTEYPWPSFEERGGRKDSVEHLQRAFEAFPEFLDEYQAAVLHVQRRNEFKKLYNGDLVREWTGLSDVDLGDFMKFNSNFGNTTLDGSLQAFLTRVCVSAQSIKEFTLCQFSIYQGFRTGPK